jgi:hypothetical protein
MSVSNPHGGKTIETKGFWIFGGLSVLLALGKITGLWAGSWWQVALPFLIFLGFNVLYIAMGFLYLSIVPVRYGPEDAESDLLRTHSDSAHYWAGFIFLACFALNVVRRLEPVEASTVWWLFSGRVEVLIAFGAFSVVSLWLYWSRIGYLLNDVEDSHS